MSKTLILIDFENEWLDKDSDYYVGDITDAISKTNKLIEFARKNNYKIIWTKHIEENSNYNFKENSFNTQIISSLDYKKEDTTITKYRISPFYKTNLDKELSQTEEVIVCGILTNLCVRSFIEGAYDRDFNIKVIKDCCVSFDKQTQEFTFKDIKETREEIEFIDLDDFL